MRQEKPPGAYACAHTHTHTRAHTGGSSAACVCIVAKQELHSVLCHRGTICTLAAVNGEVDGGPLPRERERKRAVIRLSFVFALL